MGKSLFWNLSDGLTNRPETAQTREKAIGVGNVARDLFAKFLGAWELPFFAQALPEADFDAVCVDSSCKIEQMGFHA